MRHIISSWIKQAPSGPPSMINSLIPYQTPPLEKAFGMQIPLNVLENNKPHLLRVSCSMGVYLVYVCKEELQI